MDSLQQAARDAYSTRFGAQAAEAARQTTYNQGEAARQTQFNENTAQQILNAWLQKLGVAIESGRYGTSQSTGSSSGGSSSSGFNFGFNPFG